MKLLNQCCLRVRVFCLCSAFLLALSDTSLALQVQSASADHQVSPSADHFRAWAKEFVSEPHGDLLLAEDWFDRQFKPGIAKKLSAEYRNLAKTIDELPDLIAAQKAHGRTEVTVGRFHKAIDRNATGIQNAALQRMKSPTALFTIRLTKPGESTGFTLTSFVFIDGQYRFAGKMNALNPKPGDLATSILCTMPLAAVEKLLQEKGLIDSSAEAYLKQTGVLK